MKQDANDRFHGMARLPAEAANRNDFNSAGIIGIHILALERIEVLVSQANLETLEWGRSYERYQALTSRLCGYHPGHAAQRPNLQ
jgi:hypothetical protein